MTDQDQEQLAQVVFEMEQEAVRQLTMGHTRMGVMLQKYTEKLHGVLQSALMQEAPHAGK